MTVQESAPPWPRSAHRLHVVNGSAHAAAQLAQRRHVRAGGAPPPDTHNNAAEAVRRADLAAAYDAGRQQAVRPAYMEGFRRGLTCGATAALLLAAIAYGWLA